MRRQLLGGLGSRDRALMRWLARHHAPRWLRLWMWGASRAGDGLLWLAAATGIGLFGGSARWQAIATAALAAGMGVLCFLVLKDAVRRPRPDSTLPHAVLWCGRRDEFSFPSGHSLTAFAVASPLLAFYPALGCCLMLCAVNVAVSRLVLGLHFLSDVIVGCLLGSALGYASLHLLLR